jgi:hypothetical protein
MRTASRFSGAEQAATLERLANSLGAPLHDRMLGLYRFRCPLCGGGYGDPIWRPLVLVEARGDAADGRLYCEASLERGFGPPTCVFSPAKLAAALRYFEATAA